MITPDGMAFSVCSEFVENIDPKASKQDCEHPYSDHPVALKNYYFLIQITHAWVQLLIRGRLAGAFRRSICSVKNLFRRLAESFLYELIPAEALDPAQLASIQIRLADTS